MPIRTAAALIAVTLLLTGCASAPDRRQPATRLPDQWQSDQSPRGLDVQTWWTRFQDPTLARLLQAARQDSPTLAQAVAAIDKARASRASAESGLWPSLNASADATAAGSLKKDSGTRTEGKTASGGLDASWELDLFGRTRGSVVSASALIQAREADWHDGQVSLAAEVATDYVDYRACRIRQGYYEAEADSQSKTKELTRIAARAGFTAPAEVRLAEASEASTRATALAQRTECEVLLQTLVALTGMAEPELRQALDAGPATLPTPEGLRVTAVPADLLRQRPDVYAAERALASARALIGVAEAERWPSLTLSGTIALTGTQGGASTAPWSFGPALTLPVFDAGRISADIRSARADYDSALATYQQAVRDAVKEVEQALVRLDSMAARESEASRSAAGYRAYLQATEQNWRTGGVSLLDLEIARRASITADLTLLELQQNRLENWIALYKAVGGGWQADAVTAQ